MVAPAAGCSHLTGQSVTVVAPANGALVIFVTEVFFISHTAGTEDLWYVGPGTDTNDCAFAVDQQSYMIDTIPAGDATDSLIQRSGSFSSVLPVTSGNSYTIYVNINFSSGADAGDEVNRGTIVAVFYPS
jgi:hypothetical protein